MSKYTKEIEKRRTFAIISHPDAGKTTLTEKFLLYGGAINLAGRVKGKATARHAVSDWMEIEKERGISVTSSVLQFHYDGYCINILDTPGHQDFSEDTYRTLMAADSAVMVIDGSKGVEAQTRKLFKVCVMRHIPIFTFINKMDRDANDTFDLLDEIEKELGIATCPINWPIGSGKKFRGVYDRNTNKILTFTDTQKGTKEGTIEEIDLDSTRSYHVNEYDILRNCFPNDYYVFAQNYDSAFLFYPFTQPHGSSRAGLGLFSKYPVSSALRRSFPISTSFSKFFDLDRCYSVSRIPVDNGKELVIFNLHMSAYGNSDAIRQGQIEMLCNDMAKEYEAGNYVLCGGDFNHDLKASEEDTESCESWAFPFPRSELPEHFTFCLDLLTEEEQAALWNSARNADMEYVPGVTYTVTLDGFIISDNIECLSYENVNTGYSYSDHDPVKVEFMLK